jgi:hypothetical protein
MAIEYPDIMGDYIDARQRFDAGGLHYVCSLEPASVAPGGKAELLFLVQSALDVPLEAVLQVSLPTRTGPLGRALSFKVAQPELRVNIAAGEVGLLHVPLMCAPETPKGRYEIKVAFKATASDPGGIVRPNRSPGRLGQSLIRDPVGLGIAPIIGLGYVAQPMPRQSLHLEVTEEPVQADEDLSPDFETLWTVDELEYQQKAQHEVSKRRIYILPKLSTDALYAALWRESQSSFEDAGLPLRVGEALFLARILAYTATLFLNKEDWYDALLVPTWMTALRDDLPTDDVLWVVSQVGYEHLLRLSAAVSFGLIDRAMGREVWSNEEQRGVIDLLSGTVCRGQGTLPPEFLYLPLLLGGLAVAKEMKMPGEDLDSSLQLLAQAQRDRADVFDGELAVVNDLLEQLMLAARQ